ncbi:metal-dependent hydrolase family protein [Tetragenococcus koreensis]|uniref:metal-dependent hydrolase family protein n=1 Tax=Tetragenococcus koreensis TaxID=290335 RepID=UPI001F374E5E|nr:amidohydrolase family protein [Tetragenococcus koreensis]MCF1615774.1 amidohydrolase family protein [Tetragenococcus koreensis]MCF1618253.1 amidohydrolase family protein [Tetragenococcus koreensis]MCF1623078.1 amidohydrolase family protein [Tetragenococcus koreensis]MCF1625573.1 amidohydrolase family protein [Tetragenococcus koreensis]MCF1628103.1 amidohydrolase family protein [Tetragenococcus koreensis]
MTKTLYKNAQVFTGKNEEFTAGFNFVVDDETGTFTQDEQVDQTVDLAGQYVMPGMINAHTHIVADPYAKIAQLGSPDATAPTATFLALSNLQKLLADGVTYIRDVGSVSDVDLELAALERQGDLFAPGIIASGSPLTMTGGHFSEAAYEVDGVDEVRKYARVLLKKGVDNIKLMATGGVSFNGETPHDIQLTEPELKAAVEEAHHKGRTANAHAQGTVGIQNALRAGVDSVEHAVYLDDETIDMFLQKGTYIVPTLAAPWAINQNTEQLPDFMVEKSLGLEKAHIKSIGKAAQAGVKLAMGTDSGTAFNNFDRNSSLELELMVNAGATNLQVLQAATINAANLLQVADRAGTIEPNKFADFIVLADNPLADIKAIQKEKTVYKKGKEVK